MSKTDKWIINVFPKVNRQFKVRFVRAEDTVVFVVKGICVLETILILILLYKRIKFVFLCIYKLKKLFMMKVLYKELIDNFISFAFFNVNT